MKWKKKKQYLIRLFVKIIKQGNGTIEQNYIFEILKYSYLLRDKVIPIRRHLASIQKCPVAKSVCDRFAVKFRLSCNFLVRMFSKG